MQTCKQIQNPALGSRRSTLSIDSTSSSPLSSAREWASSKAAMLHECYDAMAAWTRVRRCPQRPDILAHLASANRRDAWPRADGSHPYHETVRCARWPSLSTTYFRPGVGRGERGSRRQAGRQVLQRKKLHAVRLLYWTCTLFTVLSTLVAVVPKRRVFTGNPCALEVVRAAPRRSSHPRTQLTWCFTITQLLRKSPKSCIKFGFSGHRSTKLFRRSSNSGVRSA